MDCGYVLPCSQCREQEIHLGWKSTVRMSAPSRVVHIGDVLCLDAWGVCIFFSFFFFFF